jgi:lactoylglutathione lyase
VESPVRELRVALTVDEYEDAVRFYRDVLGLPVSEEWASPTGSGAVLEAGRATLELLSTDQTDHVDEVEAGRRGVSGPVRFALEVEDSVAMAERLVEAGAERLFEPVVTPWSHRNVRLLAPDGMQLTLFTVLDE